MYIEHVNELRASDILSEDVMIELFSLASEFEREQKLQEVQGKADELGVKAQFNKLYKAFIKDNKKEIALSDKESYVTQFTGQPELRSGVWRADMHGIWTLGEKGRVYACSHPIYPRAILTNIETKVCKIDLAFKVRNKWDHVLVNRKVIASRTSIIALADNGIRVTSENAGALVQYLSDIEALNEYDIPERMSTSRMGWVDGVFMPYEEEVIFDSEDNLRTLFESIKRVGSYDVWMNSILKERKNKRLELMIYLAASFASVLVEPLGTLPFIVDLWGGTGKGKTVALMAATSIWADPNEGEYITDAKSTQNSIEIRLGALNSLPMTIDDMAQIKNKMDDFATLIYMLCSGSSKGRATKEGGIRKTYSWKNCILTNAEHSLISETMQGGAINRVIDVECQERDIFENAHEFAEIIRHNFGHAGEVFISELKNLPEDELQGIYKHYYDELVNISNETGVKKEQKQLIPMAVILTADELSDRWIFKDGMRLDIKTCLNLLKNKNDISEGIRAYNYLMETIVSNAYRFSDDISETDHVERWGKHMDENKVAVIGRHFDKIITDAGSQPKAFLSWAKQMNLIDTDANGSPKKNVNYNGQRIRSVVIQKEWGVEDEWVTQDGYVEQIFD